MSHPKRRSFRVPAVAAAATALTAALLAPVGILTAAPAAAVVGECPPGYLPAPGNQGSLESWTDDNVAVFAGRDFLADGGAAESEGLLVVMGDATFDKAAGGPFNVGWVGVGSQVAPTPGSVMLAVGGSLAVGPTTTLDVGSGAVSPTGAGGGVHVGGTATPTYPSPRYELNNGSLETGMGAAAVSDYAGFLTEIETSSNEWLALTETSPVAVAGFQATFTGDGTSATQVFTVTAAQLNGVTEVYFENILAGAPVIINVTGGPVSFSPTYFADDGVRADDFSSPLFGMVAQRTMWNFADATSILIGGQSQLLGSMIAPEANVDISTQTNGRVYVGGDLHVYGAGNEFHNYPWIGAAEYGCVAAGDAPEQGTVELTKVLTTDGIVASDRAFFGWLRCTGTGVEGDVLYREGFIRAGQTLPGRDLPVGAECVLFEDPDREVQEVDQDPLPHGFIWAAPRWMVNGVVVETPEFVVPSVNDPAVEITVTNTLLGRFSVEKIVNGPDGGYIGDRAFDISYDCDADAYDDNGLPLGAGSDAGTLAVAAGDTETSAWFPVDTTCEISEETPATEPGDFAPGGNFSWLAPVIAPASVTIGAGDLSPVAATVTNTVRADGPGNDGGTGNGNGNGDGGGDTAGGTAADGLAATGGTVPWWVLALGGGLLLAGIVMVVLMLVRRRRS